MQITSDLKLEINFGLTLNIPDAEDDAYKIRKIAVWMDHIRSKLEKAITEIHGNKVSNVQIVDCTSYPVLDKVNPRSYERTTEILTQEALSDMFKGLSSQVKK